MNQLPESANNTLYYELYLSREPNKEIVESYKEHVRRILGEGHDIKEFKCKIHDKHKNLCHGDLKFDLRSELEWLTIYALFELSKLDNELVIRVYDNDGDVILIEAADYLPAWLESSKSESRVFIHKGKVHILPESVDLKKFKNKSQTASDMIRQQQVDTLASRDIQVAIEAQLSGLPNTEVWLAKKFKLLNEIISGERLTGDKLEHQVPIKPKESLTLNSIRAMNEESLRTSPLSSPATSSQPTDESSSNDWSTDEDVEEKT